MWLSEHACLCLLSDLSVSRQGVEPPGFCISYPSSRCCCITTRALKAESTNLLFVTRQLILGWSTDMVQFKCTWLGQSWVEVGLRSAMNGWMATGPFLFCLALFPSPSGLSLFWCRVGAQGGESHTGLKARAHNFTFLLLLHSTGQRTPESSQTHRQGVFTAQQVPLQRVWSQGGRTGDTCILQRSTALESTFSLLLPDCLPQ